LKAIIEADIQAYGEEAVCSFARVANHGSIQIRTSLNGTVEEKTGFWLRCKDGVVSYPLSSTYLIFPEPFMLLGLKSTATITLQNQNQNQNESNKEEEEVSNPKKKTKRKATIVLRAFDRHTGQVCGSFDLEPGKKQGFDIQGCFAIELHEGDASSLQVVEYTNRGGGKGNKLGMANKY